MTIRVKCRCGKSLKMATELAGKKLACPQCKRPFRISPEKLKTMVSKRRSASRQTPAARKSKFNPTSPALVQQHCSMKAVTEPEIADLSGELGLTPGPVLAELESGEQLSEHLPGSSQFESSIDGSRGTGADTVSTGGPVCPACGRNLLLRAKICVQCGINVETGRSMITKDDGRVDAAYVTAENVIRWLSWIDPIGFCPVASEAFGLYKPYVIRGFAVFTILISFWFFFYDWTGSPKMQSYKNLMLWCGEAEPTLDQISYYYEVTRYGDVDALNEKVVALAEENDQPEDRVEPENRGEIDERSESEDLRVADVAGVSIDEPVYYEVPDELILRAYEGLPANQQCLGRYHGYQLLTNAFLHAGLFHLAGNLLFLFVFGSRVNALIGSIATLVLYPVLAIGASFIFYLSATDYPPTPALGASGAIMGLAGMYLVLFPVHKVHIATWLRWGLVGGFRLSMKIFGVRGYWVVLFYISFDIFWTLVENQTNIETGTAHWAHLGGFIMGVVLGMALLVSRLINARGGDLFSALLGRRAWALIGKPRV